MEVYAKDVPFYCTKNKMMTTARECFRSCAKNKKIIESCARQELGNYIRTDEYCLKRMEKASTMICPACGHNRIHAGTLLYTCTKCLTNIVEYLPEYKKKRLKKKKQNINNTM